MPSVVVAIRFQFAIREMAIYLILYSRFSQQTQDVETMLAQCWPSVIDDGSTLILHWYNVLCLLVST